MKLAVLCLVVCALRCVSSDRHAGESIMFPDERTSLDDCELRYYPYWQRSVGYGIGGLPAQLYEFAHMGAIGWSDSSGGPISWKCGGSLILDNFVLTAAHCVVDASNVAPDVVRFGDLNIFGPEGDEHAQQIGIAEVIRHPEHRFSANYHDIALLRLERNVTINNAVIPACLWTDPEVRFGRLNAVGWGRVGFAGDQSPELLKMTLSPIPIEECSQVFNNATIRKLRFGLQQQHICAKDKKADTCEGDSGGPLEVKLVHNLKQSPFIIGVTSFGMPCGESSPGVYTRIAPYLEWILSSMRQRGALVDSQTFNTTVCALRYGDERQFYDGIVTERNGTRGFFDIYKKHLTPIGNLPSFVAKLGWTGSESRNDCYGVIVDETAVLTVADCVEHKGKPVNQLVLPNVIRIDSIHIHPRYKKGSSYNNIAILKLESLLEFGSGACIWHGYELPQNEIKTFGYGTMGLVDDVYKGQTFDPSITQLQSKITAQNSSTCKISDDYLPRMKNNLTHEHICAGNDFFLVPEACNLAVGAPLFEVTNTDKFSYDYAYGLAQFGRDCGYGEHLIATRISHHLEWIKSILLPGHQDTSGQLHFVDPDLHAGDACQFRTGASGRCVPLGECSKNWKEFLSRGNVKFCSATSVVCCPLEIADGTKSNVEEVTKCPVVVREFKVSDYDPILVRFRWDINDRVYYMCMGSIITSQVVVTTASCLGNRHPNMVQLLADIEDDSFPIDKIITHEAYNAVDGSSDIALVKIKGTLTWSSKLYPACLWMNTTHTPLITRMIYVANNELKDDQILAKYNSDCQRSRPTPLHRSQMCGRRPRGEAVCRNASDVLISQAEDGVNYLVGMALHEEQCDTWNYGTFTRISALMDWVHRELLSMK